MNSEPSNVVKFYNGEQIPLELHKVRVVQKLHLAVWKPRRKPGSTRSS